MDKYFYLCLALLCHLACTSPETKISEYQHCITIASGGCVLAAHAVAEIDQAYLIVGWGDPSGDDIADAAITGLPLERACALRKRYGDFLQGKGSGAREARLSMMDIQIIAADSSYKGTLKKARKLYSEHKNPVIRLSGREIRINPSSYRDTSLRLDDSYTAIVLADGIELEQEHYSF